MERRVLLAIFLSFLVLYAVPGVVREAGAEARDGAPATATRRAASARRPAPQPRQQPASTGRAARRRSRPRRAGATRSSATPTERDVRVETRDVIAVFTNRGARLKSWRLKHYLDQQKQPLELVGDELADRSRCRSRSRRRRCDVDGDAERRALSRQRRAGGGRPTSPVDLRSNIATAPAFTPSKEFHLDAGVLHRRVSRDGHANGDRALPPTIDVGARPSATSREMQPLHHEAPKALLVRRTARCTRLAPKDIAKQPTYDGDFRYAGVDDQLLHDRRAVAGPERGHVSAGRRFRRRRTRRTRRASSSSYSHRAAARRRRCSSSSARRISTCSRRSIATWSRAIDFGMFACPRRAAAARR